MDYAVTFSTWVNEEEPMMRGIKPDNQKFLVEADNMDEAYAYAIRFENIETDSYEGLNKVVGIDQATEEDKNRLSPLSIYEDYLKKQWPSKYK